MKTRSESREVPKILHKITRFAGGAATIALLLLAACQTQANESPTQTVAHAPMETLSRHQVITIGDIDPVDPIAKIERFQPLADYLAVHLKDSGIDEGRVVIAQDIDEMARFMREGRVDVYVDSPFPTSQVQDLVGSEIILRRWKQNAPIYWSAYLVRRDSGITSVEDFLGKVLAVEEPHSTSGFVLPLGTLIQRGFPVREVSSPTERLEPNEIGYLFTGDEENTIEMISQGLVAGGGVSNQDYDALPSQIKQDLILFDQTISVPRQLVSVRPGLDSALVDQIRDLLIGLDQTDQGRQLLASLKNTTKFDALPPESEAAIKEFKVLIDLVSD